MKKKISILFIMIMILSACGIYSFKGSLPPHIKNIAIPEFEDRTAEFDLAATISEKVRDGFISEKILDVVEMDKAHSVLYCTITSIDDQPNIYTENETSEIVDSYRVTVKIETEWKDLIKDKKIFKKTISGYNDYIDMEAREEALDKAIEKITEDIITQILSDW